MAARRAPGFCDVDPEGVGALVGASAGEKTTAFPSRTSVTRRPVDIQDRACARLRLKVLPHHVRSARAPGGRPPTSASSSAKEKETGSSAGADSSSRRRGSYFALTASRYAIRDGRAEGRRFARPRPAAPYSTSSWTTSMSSTKAWSTPATRSATCPLASSALFLIAE